jgi:hypothetical protein
MDVMIANIDYSSLPIDIIGPYLATLCGSSDISAFYDTVRFMLNFVIFFKIIPDQRK